MTEDLLPERVPDAEALSSPHPLEAEAYFPDSGVDVTLLNTPALVRRLILAGLLS